MAASTEADVLAWREWSAAYFTNPDRPVGMDIREAFAAGWNSGRDDALRDAAERVARLPAEPRTPDFLWRKDVLAALQPEAQPAGAPRLAPVVYTQGHGEPDHCDEHGDIDRHTSVAQHLADVHGLTYEQFQTLQEADRIKGVEPFDPHEHHDCRAINAPVDQERWKRATYAVADPSFDNIMAEYNRLGSDSDGR